MKSVTVGKVLVPAKEMANGVIVSYSAIPKHLVWLVAVGDNIRDWIGNATFNRVDVRAKGETAETCAAALTEKLRELAEAIDEVL